MLLSALTRCGRAAVGAATATSGPLRSAGRGLPSTLSPLPRPGAFPPAPISALLPPRSDARLASSFRPSPPQLPESVDFDQFEQCRRDAAVTIIDVRQSEELSDIGAIPGALNVPLGELESAWGLSEEQFAARYGRPRPAEDDAVVLLCMKGVRADKARDYLRQRHDYANTAVYTGSFLDWRWNMDEREGA